MKILSNGNLSYTGTCPKCGCTFELPFQEITSEKTILRRTRKFGCFHIYYHKCPQCKYDNVLLKQCKSSAPIMNDTNIPKDADEPITAQELYDFLQSFDTDSPIYLYINGGKYPLQDMSNDNGTLTLFANKFPY